MKSFAKSYSSDYLRSAWRSAPAAQPAPISDLGHETEVIRGLTLAAPIALLLWVPVIAFAMTWL